MILSGGAWWASTLGVFLAPLEHDLGWSQTQIYLGVSITYLMTLIIAPLVGWLLDRGYICRTIIAAIVMEALVFYGMSRMGSSIIVYYVLCVLMFATVLGVTPVPLTKVINGWFVQKRGLALGILFSLNYAGAMVAPVAAETLIGRIGWRQTYAVFGTAVLILALGAALLWIRNKPEHRLPAADVAPHKPAGGQRAALWSAIRQKEFLIIAVWLVLYGYSFNSISFHLVPMLEEYGLSRTHAAVAQGLIGLGGLSGNLLAGLLMDRFRAQRLATWFAIFPLVGIAFLSLWPGSASGYVMAVSLGFAVGSEGTILMYLGGRYFAPGVLGSAMSLLLIVLTIGAASGPAIAALMHAHFGNYDLFLALNAVTFIVSALIPLGLKAYRY
ncbi:MAG TPA: MFS transporter [Oleiagrimonas sp.]|nr:MFS transporter [Oleiagrimonas sp.]